MTPAVGRSPSSLRPAVLALAAVLVVAASPAPPQSRAGTPGPKGGPEPSAERAGGIAVTDLTGGLTPDDLVAALLGPSVSVSNVGFSGAGQAAGLFSGGTGTVGFEQGVILGSGCIANVVGPNSFDDITCNNGQPGDADLDALIPGFTTFDATVLEFDFECDKTATIAFQYVFASDEYNEFVFSSFNDVFGFFLNGTNVAIVPGTTSTAVSINNVNCGNPYDPTGGVNCGVYVNNDLSDGGGSIATEMDGLTAVFTATGTLLPGVNHIKLAIADAGDSALDSHVFLRGESFECGALAGPVFDPPSPCGQVLEVVRDQPLSFDVVALATNGLPGAEVALSASGVPTGATFTPRLPLTGQPAVTTFDWTPGVADVGTHVITLTAVDQLDQSTECTVTIEVAACTNAAAVATLGAPCGATLAMTPPVMGGTSTVTVTSAEPWAPGRILLSLPGGPSFPFHGCDLFVTLGSVSRLVSFVTDGSGDATIDVPVAVHTSRCGEQFVLQGVVLGPSGPFSFGSVTNALLVTLGS